MGQVNYGGKGAKGTLTAGPVQKAGQSFGGYGNQDFSALNNQASNIADYDFDVTDELEEVKYETVSHACAQSIAEARNNAGMTQAQLGSKAGLKTSDVVDIENATARYNASEINAIERALGAKIVRKRNKKK